MGNEYDPAAHAPGTVDEAQQFARYFDGQIPHLDNFLILPGFAPLGDIRQVQLSSDQKNLTQFQDRIVVPAFLLRDEDRSLSDLDVRKNRRFALSTLFLRVTIASGLNGGKHHPPADIFFMMTLSPDRESWVQLPFIIEDLGKPVEQLKQEITELQQKPDRTDAKTLVMGMKEAVYYAYTGDPMEITHLTELFYRLYTVRSGL